MWGNSEVILENHFKSRVVDTQNPSHIYPTNLNIFQVQEALAPFF